MRRRALLAVALGLGLPSRASGLDPADAPGRVHARAYHPLPDAPLAVRALDDTPANLAIARRLADALRRRGRPMRPAPAPLTVSIETEVQQVPNRDRRFPGDQRGPVRFVLTATVDDAGGRRLWNAEASYVGSPNDEAQNFLQLVEILAEEFGATIRARGFALE